MTTDVPKIPAPPTSKRLSPAEYCWAAKDTMLSMLGRTTVRDESGWRVYADAGVDVAAMTLLGSELVLDFAPPRTYERMERVRPRYAESPSRPGWLRFRQPATRDPRPGLEAELGAMLGRAARERNPPPAFRSLESAGGPYLCLPTSSVPRWGGYIEEGGREEFPDDYAAYAEIARAPEVGAVRALGDGTPAIVLGTPDALYWKSLPEGGVLARVTSFDAADPALLEQMLTRLPTEGWQSLGEIDVRERWRAFDAAEYGGGIADGNSLTIDVPVGRYVVEQRAHRPDAGTSLLLVSLRRAGATTQTPPQTQSTPETQTQSTPETQTQSTTKTKTKTKSTKTKTQTQSTKTKTKTQSTTKSAARPSGRRRAPKPKR